MEKPQLTDTFEYHKKVIGVEWFDVDGVDQLPNVAWAQVYAVCNLGGMIPLVLYADARQNLPGGSTEPGETIDQTLQRELREEINCRVISWRPIGYQRVTEPGIPEPIYQLRVYAEVQKIADFVEDVGGDVVGNILVEARVLNDEISHGRIGERIQERVMPEFSRHARGT